MRASPPSTAFASIAAFLIADRQGADVLAPDDLPVATIGCLVAIDPECPDLRAALRDALVAGRPAAVIEAMLIHAIGYVGVIRASRACAMLGPALAELGLELESSYDIDPDRQRRVDTGARLYDRFDPGRQAKQAKKFAALSDAYYPRAMEVSGLTLDHPLLSLRDRQIMTVAMLACLGGQAEQLRFHIGVALRNQVAVETIAGILILVQAYAGMPRANCAAELALAAIEALETT